MDIIIVGAAGSFIVATLTLIVFLIGRSSGVKSGFRSHLAELEAAQKERDVAIAKRDDYKSIAESHTIQWEWDEGKTEIVWKEVAGWEDTFPGKAHSGRRYAGKMTDNLSRISSEMRYAPGYLSLVIRIIVQGEWKAHLMKHFTGWDSRANLDAEEFGRMWVKFEGDSEKILSELNDFLRMPEWHLVSSDNPKYWALENSPIRMYCILTRRKERQVPPRPEVKFVEVQVAVPQADSRPRLITEIQEEAARIAAKLEVDSDLELEVEKLRKAREMEAS